LEASWREFVEECKIEIWDACLFEWIDHEKKNLCLMFQCWELCSLLYVVGTNWMFNLLNISLFFLLSRICNLALCSLVWFLWCGLWKLRIFRPWYALYDIVFGVLRYECLYFDLYVCPNVCLNHYTNEEFLQYNTQ
jgi:hypothetical protein